MLIGVTLAPIAPGESGEALLMEYDRERKRWEPGRKVVVSNDGENYPVGELRKIIINQGGDRLEIAGSEL